MGVERFDVLLRHANSGATIKQAWSKTEAFESVAWIKRMNARCHNVYIRPSGEHGLALIRSLDEKNLAKLRTKGFAPAVLVEEINDNTRRG